MGARTVGRNGRDLRRRSVVALIAAIGAVAFVVPPSAALAASAPASASAPAVGAVAEVPAPIPAGEAVPETTAPIPAGEGVTEPPDPALVGEGSAEALGATSEGAEGPAPVTAPEAEASAPALDAAAAAAAIPSSIAFGLPWRHQLDARWTGFDVEPLPSTTRTLTVTIPPDLFAFDSPVTAVIVAEQRVPVTVTSVDAASRTVSVDLPEGFFATYRPNTKVGIAQYSLGLQTSRPRPAGLVTAPYRERGDRTDGNRVSREYRSNGYVSIGFLPGPAGATEHSRVVEQDTAAWYDQNLSYWAQPAAEQLVRGGEAVTLTGAPTATGYPQVLFGLPNGNESTTNSEAAAVGETIALTIPEDPWNVDDSALNVKVSYSSGTNRITVGLPVTYVHKAASGPGVTTRAAGDDRYAGAAAFSRRVFGNGSSARPTVVLTSGEKFADSLSAAAATAHLGGSLLLARPDGDVTQASEEAVRLQTAALVAVGGPASVSDQAAKGLADAAGTPAAERIGGVDRYVVSRRTAERFWPEGAATVFVATGATFPDALSAVPAAASQKAPVLLVPGSAKALDQRTLDTLATLGTQRVVIVGGPVSVSPAIERQLALNLPGGVERISGADRFEVSAAVNMRFFPTAKEAFVATGSTFSDALTGGVLAASRQAPLLLVRPDCVPASAHAALTRWNVAKTTLLGGSQSLTAPVEDLVRCR
jgi:putative cell wall-binding protein